MFVKITAFLTAAATFISCLLCAVGISKPVNLTGTELEDYGYISENKECADCIYAVERDSFTDEETETIICLQGIANKENPCLYIIWNDAYRTYLGEYEKAGKKIIYENEDGEKWTLPLLIDEFAGKISGYTLYSHDTNAAGYNVACNYATACNYLAVPEELENLAIEKGLGKKLDISEENYNYAFQLKHFLKLKKFFGRSAVVHVKEGMDGLRDWAIQQNFYIFYTDESDAGKAYLVYILLWAGPDTAIFGWTDSEDEFVSRISRMGCYITAADHSKNNSYISSFDFENLTQPHNETKKYTDETKHYAAIVFSDGDNTQWVQNGFEAYYSKLKLDYDFPMTWTFPLIQQEISSVSEKLAYESANENNYFIGGVSGIGYIHPAEYLRTSLTKFSNRTAAAMLRSDMHILATLDASLEDIDSYPEYFDYFSRYDNIYGGICQVNPDRYASGQGKVWFSGGKPFVSVRFSLWYPTNEMADVTKEWVKEQADIVNSCPADIYSINGYSVINVHPWSISTEMLGYFVSCLDDDVQLVTADELIEMISENCPHETAVPD